MAKYYRRQVCVLERTLDEMLTVSFYRGLGRGDILPSVILRRIALVLSIILVCPFLYI